MYRLGQYTIPPMDPVENKVFDLTYNNCWGGGADLKPLLARGFNPLKSISQNGNLPQFSG